MVIGCFSFSLSMYRRERRDIAISTVAGCWIDDRIGIDEHTIERLSHRSRKRRNRSGRPAYFERHEHDSAGTCDVLPAQDRAAAVASTVDHAQPAQARRLG